MTSIPSSRILVSLQNLTDLFLLSELRHPRLREMIDDMSADPSRKRIKDTGGL